jgi:hypothetical protein
MRSNTTMYQPLKRLLHHTCTCGSLNNKVQQRCSVGAEETGGVYPRVKKKTHTQHSLSAAHTRHIMHSQTQAQHSLQDGLGLGVDVGRWSHGLTLGLLVCGGDLHPLLGPAAQSKPYK